MLIRQSQLYEELMLEMTKPVKTSPRGVYSCQSSATSGAAFRGWSRAGENCPPFFGVDTHSPYLRLYHGKIGLPAGVLPTVPLDGVCPNNSDSVQRHRPTDTTLYDSTSRLIGCGGSCSPSTRSWCVCNNTVIYYALVLRERAERQHARVMKVQRTEYTIGTP